MKNNQMIRAILMKQLQLEDWEGSLLWKRNMRMMLLKPFSKTKRSIRKEKWGSQRGKKGKGRRKQGCARM